MVVGDIWVANYINGLFGKPSDSSLEEFSLILCLEPLFVWQPVEENMEPNQFYANLGQHDLN